MDANGSKKYVSLGLMQQNSIQPAAPEVVKLAMNIDVGLTRVRPRGSRPGVPGIRPIDHSAGFERPV